MGQNAVYIAIDGDSLDSLWPLDDQSFRDRLLQMEEDASLKRLDIAKIWDALHCTMTGVSASNPIEGDKRSEAIVGVHPRIYGDDDYSVFVSVIDNEDLAGILLALEEFDFKKLVSLIDPATWRRQKLYPHGIWLGDTAELAAEMDEALRAIREFFRNSQQAGKHVLATIL